MDQRTAQLETLRNLLKQLDITPEQLLHGTTAASVAIPTFDEYVWQVAEAVSPGTRRVYGSYWQRICQHWGTRRITEPTPLEIKRLAEEIRRDVVVRRNARGGRTAAEHLIAAMRCIYRHAVMDGLIRQTDNPAAKVPKPRRLASTRRALTETQLAAISNIATTTGNDPHLDGLLIRLHMETACRRGGALTLRLRDLDPDNCLIFLREKGGTSRWQPVSPTLTRHLLAHHAERGDGDREGPLLRYRDGRALTYRRYDYLWRRVGTHLPWVVAQQVSTHWLRHTTLTWVERAFSYAVARAYAGHSGKNDVGTTMTYVRAEVQEVAAALAALTGEPHPLAPGTSRQDHLPRAQPTAPAGGCDWPPVAQPGAGLPAQREPSS
ncbi:site-specific integrase [Micromonospora sp. Llam0]|uniref:tyrosine-type recombinase/integrase n=1 Tax=Micromonospora sp. Llam0 TaxID=2485143 RepID=UPI000F49DC9C|nr:site-specific integrase [Micromonospora sp. Llam0]